MGALPVVRGFCVRGSGLLSVDILSGSATKLRRKRKQPRFNNRAFHQPDPKQKKPATNQGWGFCADLDEHPLAGANRQHCHAVNKLNHNRKVSLLAAVCQEASSRRILALIGRLGECDIITGGEAPAKQSSGAYRSETMKSVPSPVSPPAMP
jgi:hypothetical protein